MSVIAEVAELVEVLNGLKALKVALGFREDESIADMITQVKGATTALSAAAGIAPTA